MLIIKNPIGTDIFIFPVENESYVGYDHGGHHSDNGYYRWGRVVCGKKVE